MARQTREHRQKKRIVRTLIFPTVLNGCETWTMSLRSSARGELLVPRAHSALKQRRAFSVIGPSTWNELPLTLRLLPQNNMPSFCKLLKAFLFDRSWTESASE